MERIVFLFSSWDMRFVPAIFAAVFGLLVGVSHQNAKDRNARGRRASEQGVDEESPINKCGVGTMGTMRWRNNRHLIFLHWRGRRQCSG